MQTEKPNVRTGIYRHEKTGNKYVVVGLARCGTNGREGRWDVIYQRFMRSDLTFTRDADEFLSPGRFTYIGDRPDGGR